MSAIGIHGMPGDFDMERLAAGYSSSEEFKREVDLALGVYHVPPHPPAVCPLCDAKRERERLADRAAG